MKKTLITVLLIAFVISGIQSQSDYQNHRKYWYYKTRLNNDFLKVGTNRGDSWPFNQRADGAQYLYNGNYQWSSSMRSGDGTSTLGHYIGVLATEYQLLKSNSQETAKVKHELFCALSAFNRADAYAEAANSSQLNTPTALNGFFLRDEIPSDYVYNNYKHFNYYNTWDGTTVNNYGPVTLQNDRGFASVSEVGQAYTISTYKDFTQMMNSNTGLPVENNVGPGEDYSHKFTSQDQVYNMLLGLALVSKFVDDNATDNGAIFDYEGQGVSSLRQEARNIADRIIQHIRNDNTWSIEYPGTNQNVFGGIAGEYSYAIAESGCFISGNGEAPLLQIGNVLQSPKGCGGMSSSTGYHNWFSGNILAFDTWNALAKIPGITMDQAVFAANLSAICNCVYGTTGGYWVNQWIDSWEHVPVLNWLGWIIKWVWRLVQVLISVFNPFEINNVTAAAMILNAHDNDLDYAPLARKVLHGGVFLENPQHTFEYLLNTAPCQGTYNFGNGNYGGYQWSADNRCDHPNRIGTNPVADGGFPGEYNGIDYMLYHNLWYIHKQQQSGNQGIIDVSDLYINKNGGNIIPTGPQFYAHAFETIVTEKTNVPNTTSGEFRAGKTITLKPGVSITGNTHLYIKPFSCRSNEYSRTADDNFIYPVNNPHKTEYNDKDEVKLTQNETPKEDFSNNTTVYVNQPVPSQAYQDSVIRAYSLVTQGDQLKVISVPEKNTATVYFRLQEEEFANLVMIDMKGQKMFEANNITQNDNGLSISMENFAAGMYIIKFTRSSGKEESKKIYKL